MFGDMIVRLTELLGGFAPNLIGAVGIFVVGWIVALVATVIIRDALKRTTLDNRSASFTFGLGASQVAGSVVEDRSKRLKSGDN